MGDMFPKESKKDSRQGMSDEELEQTANEVYDIEPSVNDMMLAEIGIMPKYAKMFKEETGKNAVYQGKITKGFFEFLMKKIEQNDLGYIEREKLKEYPEFQEMLDIRRSVDKLDEDLFGGDEPQSEGKSGSVQNDLQDLNSAGEPVVNLYSSNGMKREEESEGIPSIDPKPTEKSMFDKTEEKPKEKIAITVPKKTKKHKNPIIILIWGDDGTSKSEQILKFKPPPIVIDLENKLKACSEGGFSIVNKLGFPPENVIVASKYNEKYDISGPNTLGEIRNVLSSIRKKIREGEDIPAIALDGITDIRPFAVREWLEETGRDRPYTAGDWRDINDKVRDICFQIINIGRAEGVSVFFTAQVTGRYEKNIRKEDIPDCKNWIWHNVDHKFRFIKDNNQKKFLAYCEKSYYDPFFTLDLTDWTHGEKPSLMNILQDPKLLEIYKKQHTQEQQDIIEEKVNGSSMFPPK